MKEIDLLKQIEKVTKELEGVTKEITVKSGTVSAFVEGTAKVLRIVINKDLDSLDKNELENDLLELDTNIHKYFEETVKDLFSKESLESLFNLEEPSKEEENNNVS